MFIPENFAQVNLKFTGDDLPTGAEMTFGLRHDVAALTPLEVAQAVSQAWGTTAELFDYQTTQVSQDRVLVKFGPNDTGPSVEYSNPWNGSIAQDTVTANTAVLIRKTTAVGGRRGRGRMFMPGLPENQVDGSGALNTTYQAGIQTSWNNFFDALEGADLPLYLLHSEGPAILVPPVPLTSLDVSATAATQRRRLRR